MTTITYNPETHVLVPIEPTRDMVIAGTHQRFRDSYDAEEDCYRAMIAAAPQPEQVDVGSVGWKHDCAALCANDIELWIDRCPHCGKPRHNHPPTDDELLNKAEPVESEPAMWVMKHIRSGDLAQAKPNQKALHPYMWSDAFPRYTTPQPDRVAELIAELEHIREQKNRLWFEFSIATQQLAAAQEEIKRLRIALDCTKMDLVRMRCPDFFEGVKDGYETLFDGHLVNMIWLINDYAKQK